MSTIAPVAQWIVHKIADLEVVGSTPAGRAAQLVGSHSGLVRWFRKPVSAKTDREFDSHSHRTVIPGGICVR